MEMKMEFLRKLPAPEELKQQFPVSAQIAEQKAKRDEEICRILEGTVFCGSGRRGDRIYHQTAGRSGESIG